jgi:hypothetical protein
MWCRKLIRNSFKKNSGTREAILRLRIMIERSIHEKMHLHIALVDLKKAFDNVEWEEIFGLLGKPGIDYNDGRIIYQVNKKQVATIRVRDGSQIEAKINKIFTRGWDF